MRTRKIIRLLSSFHIFRGLAEEELKLFAGICESASFSENDVLVREGQMGAAIHLITRGRVKVFLPREIEGKHEHRISAIKLNVLKASECFGEYSLIDNRPASASVLALVMPLRAAALGLLYGDLAARHADSGENDSNA